MNKELGIQNKGKIVIQFFRERPWLSLLSVLVLGVIFASFKPQYYFLGWDNFSSYFSLPTNIFRTFFATWRQYRGLGVASDSESVDLFRQLFALALSPFLPEQVLEQVYVLGSFSVGIFSMYALAAFIYKTYLSSHWSEKRQDLFAFVAAFFYMCNLHTLATFYFPMMMYITRFYSIPLLFYIVLWLVNAQKISKKQYALIIAAFFFISGSYITGTIFITMLIALSVLFIFLHNKKRVFFLILLYIGINAFWLLPFANYTHEKSGIIRLAPTFISANETQLNKAASFYDLSKQLTLYHNFFDTDFYNITGTQKEYFHPITKEYRDPLYLVILWLFPALYMLGSLYLVWRFKKYKQLLWIPGIIFLFLFLSLKEFSVLGFFYDFLNHLTPLFGVLFRFGDTKFHVYISFAGSLAAAVAVLYISSKLKVQSSKFQIKTQTVMVIFIVLLVIPTLFVYRDYWSGRFVGFFFYNKIPAAYFSIAKTINSDPDSFRVLHLPFDREAYWKTYEWGAVGSSFFNFMIKAPLIDKTFEPASQENAYVHQKIVDLLANAQLLDSKQERKNRTAQLALLLQKLGVKYVVIDGTVQKTIYPRGITLWGDYYSPDMLSVASNLKEFGYAKTVKKYTVPLSADTYSPFHKLSKTEQKLLAQNNNPTIELLELNHVQPEISAASSSALLDPAMENVFAGDLLSGAKQWVQDAQKSAYEFFPFKRTNALLTQGKQGFTFTFNQAFPTENKALITIPKETSVLEKDSISYIDVYISQTDESIVVELYNRLTPTINGYTQKEKIKEITIPKKPLEQYPDYKSNIKSYISDWSTLDFDTAGPFRLKVGNYILPLPNTITKKASYVTTVAVEGRQPEVSVLRYYSAENASLFDLNVTENPNCFYDRLPEISYQSVVVGKDYHIISQNQSTCILYDMAPTMTPVIAYVEVGMNLSGKSVDLDSDYSRALPGTSKPLLKEAIVSLPKPNLLNVCIKQQNIDDCYNQHQFINVSHKSNIILPLETPLSGATNLTMLLSLKNIGYQRQDIRIKKIAVNRFIEVLSDTLDLGATHTLSTKVALPNTQKLVVSVPKVLSPYSYFLNPAKEGLYGQNPSCDKEGGYRTFRQLNSSLITYVDNCYIQLFQQARFKSTNYYLWDFSYNLLSGKYPKFQVKDDFFFDTDEYVSLHQGYPDVPGFKTFQTPEMFLSSLGRSPATILHQIKALPVQNAFGYLLPIPEVSDVGNKDLTIHQDSENEGVMKVNSFLIQPMPQSWANISIRPDKTTVQYLLPKKLSFTQLLPSLWSTTITASQKGNMLIVFNEGYDKQWVMYDSWFGVITGLGGRVEAQRCNGYANCFVVPSRSVGSKSYYILYTPERLMVLGWLVTLVAGVVGYKKLVGKKYKALLPGKKVLLLPSVASEPAKEEVLFQREGNEPIVQ